MNSALLGSLVEIKGGGTPRRDLPEYWGGSIPWATVKDFVTTEIDSTQESITELGVSKSSTNIIPAGNIIVPTRMALGKAAINLVDVAINQDLKALIPIDPRTINRGYLFRFLLSKARYIESRGKGATVKGIGLDVLKELEVPLPPVEKQKRIAAILGKADAIRRKRRQAIQLADEFLRSVFLDMFGDPVLNPKGWKTVSVGENLSFLTSGSRGWAKYYSNEGRLFLRIQNIGSNQLFLDDIAYVNPPDSAEARRAMVQAGDVLLSITADLGRTAVIPSDLPPAHINQHLAILRFDSIEPIFASAFLASKGGQTQIQKLNREGVKAGLNFENIRTLNIFLPPKELQKKWSDIYNKNFTQKSLLKQSLRTQTKLFNSLTQRAFRGEL